VRKTRPSPPRGQKKSPKTLENTPGSVRASRPNIWLYLALFLTTFIIYGQVRHFDFVNLDDPEYITDNPHVLSGITPEGVKWAFTSNYAANWFPLTWLSHMLDCQLFGLQSGFHHLTNELLHALATLLLFAFLNRASHARWPSAFVAFVFALHPLHVESVAWVAERKDVLSAFFWFLALYAYVRYSEDRKPANYLLTFCAFCLGLLAKPMIVTLPFVLLLLDAWPLRRLTFGSLKSRFVEKVPFFAASAVVVVITYLVQQGSGAVKGLPIGLRAENALVSYLIYIGRTFWPTRLAVFYPYPADIPAWQVAISSLIILGISAAVLRLFPRYPYLAVGWLWYLGTLLPVIGLVQVGAQARADRYMYVPMVGLSIMLAWSGADILRQWPRTRVALAALTILACSSCLVLTYLQIQYWKNSEVLFQHALNVTDENYLAHHNLGTYLLDVPGRLPDAVTHLQAAVRIRPDSATARTDLGNALSKIPDRIQEAISQYQMALRIAPDSPIPHYDLANTLSKIPNRLPEAISQYQAALRIKPDYLEARSALADAHNNRGVTLSHMPGRLSEAVLEYEAALRLEPDSAEVHYDLGIALSKIDGRLPDAIGQFEAALRLKPDYADAHNNLGVVLSQIDGRLPEAIDHFETALRIRPDYADAHYNLGIALSNIKGRLPEAISQLETAQRIRPDPEVQQMIDRLRSVH
jgi:protein O-mannosyl-transferase